MCDPVSVESQLNDHEARIHALETPPVPRPARHLLPGEQLQPGDEYFTTTGREWVPVIFQHCLPTPMFVSQGAYGLYRRPAAAKTPKKEYVFVKEPLLWDGNGWVSKSLTKAKLDAAADKMRIAELEQELTELKKYWRTQGDTILRLFKENDELKAQLASKKTEYRVLADNETIEPGDFFTNPPRYNGQHCERYAAVGEWVHSTVKQWKEAWGHMGISDNGARVERKIVVS